MGMFWVFDMKGGVVVVSNTKNASRRLHMGTIWVFVVKGWVVVASNMKNVSHRTCFACSCEPGLEGMCRVDGEDRKHAHRGVFSVLAVRGGEEDAKGRTFWLFGGRKKTPNTKNAPLRAHFSCLACGWVKK